MPYAVCDATQLKLGHLGLMASQGGNRPVFPLELRDQRYLLMLPTTIPDPRRDFRIRRMGFLGTKTLDLGSEYYFDFSLETALLLEHEIRGDAGSLILIDSSKMLMGNFALDEAGHQLERATVAIQSGQLYAGAYREGCELSSWRLFVPSAVPNEPAKLISQWPGTASAAQP